MAKPNIKFGDILKYSDEWYQVSLKQRNKWRFLATGRITGKSPDWLIDVVREGTSYMQRYHHTFLTKEANNDKRRG